MAGRLSHAIADLGRWGSIRQALVLSEADATGGDIRLVPPVRHLDRQRLPVLGQRQPRHQPRSRAWASRKVAMPGPQEASVASRR